MRLPYPLARGLVFAAVSLVAVMSWSSQVRAADDASAAVYTEALSLKKAVIRALGRNLDITISRHNTQVRLTDILFEQANFDPTVSLSGSYDRTIQPLNQQAFFLVSGVDALDEPQVLDQNVSTWSLGLSQRLLTGAEYDLTYEPQRTFIAGETRTIFNAAWESTLSLTLTQPLLKDFGSDVNRTQIEIARNNARVEDHIFLDSVLTVIASVEENYWELVFAREGLKVAQIALRAAQELEASNQAKAKVGVMTIVDVLQAQAAVASRQEEVIIAEKGILDQEDLLRRLLNPSEAELQQRVEVIPSDKPVQTLQPLILHEVIEVAMERRPEVLQARTNIKSSDLNVKFAKNQILPSLNLEGSGSLIGLGEDFSDMNDRGFSGDFYNYGVGLVLSYPLGNRSAWSQYRKRQLQARNAQVSLQSARQEVIINVKEAVRRVQTDFKRIEATRSARMLAARQLKAEEERLAVGLTTTRFVLDFQRDLAIAQRNELRAVVDYNKSISNLARQKATTLETYEIRLK